MKLPIDATHAQTVRWYDSRFGIVYSGIASLVRSLPMLFWKVPGTPLRVLCIAALDHVHRTCYGTCLSKKRIEDLSHFLLYAAETNAQLDGKRVSPNRLGLAKQSLVSSGWGSLVQSHYQDLCQIENERPKLPVSIGEFRAIKLYRERVVRLSIRSLLMMARSDSTNDSESRYWRFELPFARLSMLFQLVDDFMDVAEDREANLPSLVTGLAHESDPKSILKLWINDYSKWEVPQIHRREILLQSLIVVLASTLKGLLWLVPNQYLLPTRKSNGNERPKSCHSNEFASPNSSSASLGP